MRTEMQEVEEREVVVREFTEILCDLCEEESIEVDRFCVVDTGWNYVYSPELERTADFCPECSKWIVENLG